MLDDALQVVDVAAGIGATIIVTLSRLFRPLQNLGKFFRCPLCVGFWVGFGLLAVNSVKLYGFFEPFDAFKSGCVISLGSYTWFLLMKGFINKYD